MTTILLSPHCTRFTDIFFCESIVELLHSYGYGVDILTKIPLGKKANYIEPDKVSIAKYDVVISFNLAGYRKIRKYVKQRKFAHIYMCCRSNIMAEFLCDNEAFDSFITILDQQNGSSHLFQGAHIRKLLMPFSKWRMAFQKQSREKLRLLVNTSQYETFLSILPIINQLQDTEVAVITNRKIPRDLLNHHISTVHAKLTLELQQLVENSDIIVGDGFAVLLGLMYQKQTIVVGERGLGGLVNGDNIGIFFDSGFSGRIGAERGEHIPGQLLSEELSRAIQKVKQSDPYSSDIQDYLFQLCEQTSLSLKKIIEAGVKQSKCLWETRLRKNQHLIIYSAPNAQRVIFDGTSGKMLFLIDEDEYSIIQSFDRIATPSEVFLKFSYQKDYFINYVGQLVANKILINHE